VKRRRSIGVGDPREQAALCFENYMKKEGVVRRVRGS